MPHNSDDFRAAVQNEINALIPGLVTYEALDVRLRAANDETRLMLEEVRDDLTGMFEDHKAQVGKMMTSLDAHMRASEARLSVERKALQTIVTEMRETTSRVTAYFDVHRTRVDGLESAVRAAEISAINTANDLKNIREEIFGDPMDHHSDSVKSILRDIQRDSLARHAQLTDSIQSIDGRLNHIEAWRARQDEIIGMAIKTARSSASWLFNTWKGRALIAAAVGAITLSNEVGIADDVSRIVGQLLGTR